MNYQLQFAGSGSAFTVGHKNYHSNIVLTSPNGQNFLIDCGTDARLSLYELGLTYQDIHHVYISHLHADHSGGLEWLGFTCYFDKNCKKPTLYIHHEMLEPLWDKSLAAGMSSLEKTPATLKDFFDIKSLNDTPFIWEGCQIKPVKTIHVVSNHKNMPCYGLFIKTPNTKIYITADTQFQPDILMPYYQQADIIFHDCDITCIKNPVHATYEELKTLPIEIKNKMWLYHYPSDNLPNAQGDGFLGFVKKGQSFTV